ncbi:MAG: DNA-3-methyladenine glycosylase [Gaiella sp.]
MAIARLRELLTRPSTDAARGLLGWALFVDGVGGTITEVEAYDQEDAASHSYGGPRGRNTVMFGPAGHLYVYRSYGLHWCANVVCGPEGHGAAVLLRALEPTRGLAEMRARRGVDDERLLCAGPGRLAQALGLTGADTGAPVDDPRFAWVAPAGSVPVTAGRRIGISKDVEREWRYTLTGSPTSRGRR